MPPPPPGWLCLCAPEPAAAAFITHTAGCACVLWNPLLPHASNTLLAVPVLFGTCSLLPHATAMRASGHVSQAACIARQPNACLHVACVFLNSLPTPR